MLNLILFLSSLVIVPFILSSIIPLCDYLSNRLRYKRAQQEMNEKQICSNIDIIKVAEIYHCFDKTYPPLRQGLTNKEFEFRCAQEYSIPLP